MKDSLLNWRRVTAYITPLESIAICKPDTTIGSALEAVDGTHDPVMVINENDELLGLISTYSALYTKRHPLTTAAKSAVVIPPYLFEDSSLFEEIDFMLSSRIYTLPVFEKNGQIIGVIKAETILDKLLTTPDILNVIGKDIKISKPITASIQTNVNEIYRLTKKKEISRVILTDEKNKLAGIISRSDLEYAFYKPAPRERFKDHGMTNYWSFDQEKLKRLDYPARNYAKQKVSTVADTQPMVDIIKKLIKSDNRSIVLINKNNEPSGLLSTRDILEGLHKLEPETLVRIRFKKPSDNVSLKEQHKAHYILEQFGLKYTKRNTIEWIEVGFKESKSAAKKTLMYHTTVKVIFLNGEFLVADAKHKDYIASVRATLDKLERQIENTQEKQVKDLHKNLEAIYPVMP
ncbi:MAG TPA: CBS domain-containing protein [Candidatus Nitrosocosmicus sp.]|nr:CBS domain-containing protein [Candidatus Nitrosocosmicus sp.]